MPPYPAKWSRFSPQLETNGTEWEQSVDAMDRLFDLYNEYFDRLKERGRRFNERYPETLESPLQRMTRVQFEQFLASGVDNLSKRLFIKRVLNGHNELLPMLPNHVQALTQRAA